MPKHTQIVLLEPPVTPGGGLLSRLGDTLFAQSPVRVARSVSEAETLLHQSPADLILTSLEDLAQAPIDAIHRLHEACPRAPIVSLALDMHDDVALIEAGAEDVLPPDVDAIGLQRALRFALARHGQEHELKMNSEELRLLFDRNPSPILVYARDTLQLLAVNEAAARMYGDSRENLLGSNIEQLLTEEDAARLRELMKAGMPDHYQGGVWRHRRADGSTIYVEVNLYAFMSRGRRARMAQLRDVTIERKANQALQLSERRFRDLFEHSLGFIGTHDLDGQILSINPAAAQALGYRVAELLGLRLPDLMPERLRATFPGYLAELAREREVNGIMVLKHRDGSERAWQYRNRLFEDAYGETTVMAYAQDITRMRAIQQALSRSEQRIRTITDALPLRVGFIDPDMRYVYVNAYYERYFGRRREDIIGMKVGEVIGDESFARRRSRLKRALAGEYQHFEDESGGGRDFACEEITLLPEWSESGDRILGVHVMVQDATARKLEEIRLTKLAQLDQLTGLLNRSGYNDRLQRALQRSDDQEMSLALLYLDLDGFKPVNDQHGHAAGDRLLHLLARRLQQTVRTSDTLARLGGDEFAVIMEGVSSSKTAVAMSERIIRAVQDPFVLTNEQGSITVQVGTSIGIALHSETAESAETLNRRADEALYEAKHAGRGTWRLAEAA